MVFVQYLEFRDLRLVLSRWTTFNKAMINYELGHKYSRL